MKTSTGFEFEVLETAKDNMELLDCLVELSAENVTNFKQTARYLIGEDGQKALYEYCREDGVVKSSKVFAELVDIINAFTTQEKNS